MSTLGTNWVNDEEMSSQGSVNAPVAPMDNTSGQRQELQPQDSISPGDSVPTVLPQSVQTQLSVVSGGVPVPGTSLLVAEGVSRQEAEEAFSQVTTVIGEMTEEHGKIQSGLHALAGHIEHVSQQHSGEMATVTAQTQEALRRTSSKTSEMDARLTTAEVQQQQMRETAERARHVSERALLQAESVKREQQFAMSSMEQTVSLETQQAKVQAQKAVDVASQAITEAKKVAATVPQYEQQIAQLQKDLQDMQMHYRDQRSHTLKLEGQLSAAQDRIGAAERKVKLAEERNTKLQADVQFWNDVYSQDAQSWIGARPPSWNVPVSSTSVGNPMQESRKTTSPFDLITGEHAQKFVSSQSMPVQMSIPMLSVSAGPTQGTKWPSMIPRCTESGPMQHQTQDMTGGSNGPSELTFAMSSRGNGSGNGTQNMEMSPDVPPSFLVDHANTQRIPSEFSQTMQFNQSTFAVQIKPKDPPSFHGRANEDVVTWVAKVQDFFYLTGANPQQQVAYAATLLLDAAADWWTSLIRERHGLRPTDFLEFSVLLEKRFGSTTRVDRARAELRNVHQAQSESVRAYSTRFEALLSKLPSYDQGWAKSQFVWGLHTRIAELVTIAAPPDLSSAIRKAEEIEMARNVAYAGGAQHQPRQSGSSRFPRGRGRFSRGRFAMIQNAPGQTVVVPPAGNSGSTTQVAAVNQNTINQQRRTAYNQCAKCRGFGHWAADCPSRGGRGRRGGRFGRGRGRGGRRGGRAGQQVNAALAMSAPDATGEELQIPPGAAQVIPSQGN